MWVTVIKSKKQNKTKQKEMQPERKKRKHKFWKPQILNVSFWNNREIEQEKKIIKDAIQGNVLDLQDN